MDNLYIVIRHMTSDSRMISLATGLPQYKIDQLKVRLFLGPEEQNRATCEWWLRLYRSEFTKDDVRKLVEQLEKL